MSQFEEIEDAIPRSFHDAFLRGVSVDYVARTAELEFEIWVGSLDSQDHDVREAYRRGRLRLSGLLFLTVDIPNREILPDRPTGLQIDRISQDSDPFLHPEWPIESLPLNAFFASFVFTSDWNSGLHVAAHQAAWTWLSGPRAIY